MKVNKEYSLCAVIPVYNHSKSAFKVVETLSLKEINVILVDDGGSADAHNDLLQICKRFQNCSLVTLEENQGKGGAVMAGLLEAYKNGFTHGLQVDADGQHDLSNIDSFVLESKSNFEYLIGGYPSYDESVPKARKIGRKLTTSCVWIETLSTDIKDAMCGYRIYPLEPTCHLIKRAKLKRRMDFDIDIIVRLHWMGVRMKFIPVNVVYPEDGHSNFRMFRDNVAISKIHTLLIIGMVFRLPGFIFRKLFRKGRAL